VNTLPRGTKSAQVEGAQPRGSPRTASWSIRGTVVVSRRLAIRQASQEPSQGILEKRAKHAGANEVAVAGVARSTGPKGFRKEGRPGCQEGG